MDLISCSKFLNNSTQIIFITNIKTTRNVGEKNPRTNRPLTQTRKEAQTKVKMRFLLKNFRVQHVDEMAKPAKTVDKINVNGQLYIYQRMGKST